MEGRLTIPVAAVPLTLTGDDLRASPTSLVTLRDSRSEFARCFNARFPYGTTRKRSVAWRPRPILQKENRRPESSAALGAVCDASADLLVGVAHAYSQIGNTALTT